MPSFELRCLGPPLLVTASGEPVRFRTRKHFALLIRLAVEPGKTVSRDSLTELLWPAAAPSKAAHSLSQALSVIRARLGREHLLVQRAGVALAEGALWVDVRRLETCDGEIRGGFLDGFDVPEARPFDDWKDEWRAKVMPRLRDCLVKQMDGGRRYGDFATVERHARVLYEMDPVSEDAVRGLIEARAWVGDRTNALKVYAAHAARLADELGAKPSAELQRMADLLREGRRPTRPRAVGEPAAGRAERRVEPETVIGRQREFSALYDAWLAARRRVPRVMVILGDPGLGKTTLVNAFVSTCQLDGAVVARAQAYDAERELPFAVLAELVRQLTVQRAIGCADPEALSELSRVSPELVAAFPGVPKPVDWAPEVTPLRLADAFLKTITAAAEESPVVLVVDDIHAADNASTAILHVVARKLPQARLLVILAARPGELRHAGAPAALTSDAMIEGLQALDLDPLPADASGQLVERVAVEAGATAGDVPQQRILDAGRGNPLALELLTREWVAHGPESLLRDLEAVNTQPVAAIGIPRAIKAVFDRQVARLDRKTRAVLDLAAVLGRRLADLSLYRAVDCTPIDAAEGLARLRDAGFVREIQGGVEFRNELIRAQAYYAVPGAVRQYLHRCVGDLLEGHRGDPLNVVALETAWHYVRGGSTARAVAPALLGAAASRRAGAPFEAEQLLLGLLHDSPSLPGRSKVQLALAGSLLDQSKAWDATPLLESLAQVNDLNDEDHAEARILQATSEYLLNRETGRLHIEAAQRALAEAQNANSLDLLVRALFEYARAGAESGSEQMVAEARGRIVEILRMPPGPRIARAHLTLAFCNHFAHDARGAVSALAPALELLSDSTDLPQLSLAFSGLGNADFVLCRFGDATAAFLKALNYAKQVGDDSRASLLAANLTSVFTFAGRCDEAIEYGLLSIDWGRRARTQPFLIAAYTNLIDPYVLKGSFDAAFECLEQARRWTDNHDRSWYSRSTLLLEEINLALVTRNSSLAVKLIDALERHAYGHECGIPFPGFYHRARVFKARAMGDLASALSHARAALNLFRDRSPLYYLDAISAMAWLETQMSGSYSAETVGALADFHRLGAVGRLRVLEAQGFVDLVPVMNALATNCTTSGEARSEV